MRRVVVTGLGLVTPLGGDVETTWQHLIAGKSGIGLIEQFDTSRHDVKFGGEVKGFDPAAVLGTREARRLDRFAQFGMMAAFPAVKDSGLDFGKEDPTRCGVIAGSGIGGLNEFEEQHARLLDGGPGKISPFVIPKMIPNAAPGNISIHFGLCGPNTAVSTACASAAHAVGDAMRAVQWDYADVMIAGGAEAPLAPLCFGAFSIIRAMSTRNDDPARASRPFDLARDGFVMQTLGQLGHNARPGRT